MKNLLLFVLLFFTIEIVVGQQEFRAKIVIDTLVYENDSANIIEQKIVFREIMNLSKETCKKDSLRANEEAKYNVTYSLPLTSPAMSSDFFLAEKEFSQLLRKNKIGYGGFILGNCFGIPDNCFQWEMNRIVEEKYGMKFIENLQFKAVKNFLLNNPKRIFEYEECDFESRYASAKDYGEMMDKMKEDYLKTFEYPEQFIFKKANDRSSRVEANFILDAKGNVSKIQVELTLQEKKNYIYSAYLIGSVKEFIEKAKWKAATYKGVPVNSKMNYLIFYK